MASKTTAKDKASVVSEAESCPVCIEPYTKAIRKQVSCQYCHESTCSKCLEKYLMNTIEDPHCMHCRKAWSRAVLGTMVTKTFLNGEYIKARQNILLNREKSFIPQLQVHAEREMRARTLEKQNEEITKEYNKVMAEYNRAIGLIQQKRSDLYRRINRVRSGLDEGGTGHEASKKIEAERQKFVRRCTADGCKGFLSSVWKCGLCSVWVCPDCFEVKGTNKDDPHTCKKENLETAALIKKDTKPCPTCGEIIMKTDGCDQMWCTSCHNAFSWVTGKVVTTGTIHNPHYFQWLQKGGQVPQNPGNIPCGGLPDAYNMRRKLQNVPAPDLTRFSEIYRICAHVIDVERHRYERHLAPNNNQDIGVKYMLNEMSEEDWKKELARREKERQKSNEIRDILDAFNGATIDIFRRIDVYGGNYTKEQQIELVKTITEELSGLRQFTMDAMCDVSRSFNCSIPIIMPDWKVEHGKYTVLYPAKKRVAKKKEDKPANAGAGKAESDSDSDDD